MPPHAPSTCIPRNVPMKSTAIATLAAVAAISLSAHAATGMPSVQETGGQNARIISTQDQAREDAQPGSYARYLMLNGKTRDTAVAEARSVDHAGAGDGVVAAAQG